MHRNRVRQETALPCCGTDRGGRHTPGVPQEKAKCRAKRRRCISDGWLTVSFLAAPQVGVGVIYLEYRRNERNAEEKKKKEEAYRRHLDMGVHRDREVGIWSPGRHHILWLSMCT